MNTPATLLPHPARHRDARALLGRKPLDAALASGVLCQPWRGVVMRSDQALDTRTRAVAALLSVGEHAVNARLSRRHDQRGVTQAKLLTDLATGMADSPPESVFRLVVVEAGLPVPTPQFEIRTVNGRLLYVLDMAWEEVRIALEYDGYAAHEERTEYDADRDRRLAARGWLVIRARAADLRDPTRVLGALHAAFAARR